MQGDPRQQLEEQRRSAIREASERLTADPAADVAGLLKRIEAHDKLLAALPQRSWEWAKAAAVAFLCLAVVAGLWSYRLRTASVSFSVDAETIELSLANAWAWEDRVPISGSRISLSHLATIDLPPVPGMPTRVEQDAWLKIEGGEATLKSLTLGADGVLAIERNGDETTLYGKGAAFTGEIALWGGATLAAGNADGEMPPHTISFEEAETVTFSGGGAAIVPASVAVIPEGPVSFVELQVSGVRFGREVADASGNLGFVSTITGGNLVLSDTGTTVALERGGRLRLEEVEGRVGEIRIADGMTIAFDGRARRIVLGPEGSEIDLRPSLLDYLYHNSRLGFLWSSAVFIWGMLWSIRRLLFA